jgi:hypothetical protein
MNIKYYVKYSKSEPEVEVSLTEYIRVEKLGGFSGPGHYEYPPSAATSAFNDASLGYSGRTDYGKTF